MGKHESMTDAELISDLCCWEDPDAMLFVTSSEDGMISISDQVWKHFGKGFTFRDALLDFAEDINHVWRAWEEEE